MTRLVRKLSPSLSLTLVPSGFATCYNFAIPCKTAFQNRRVSLFMKLKLALVPIVWIWSFGWTGTTGQARSVDHISLLWSASTNEITGVKENCASVQKKERIGSVFNTSRAGIAFIDSKHVLVYEVLVDPTQLSSRQSPDLSQPVPTQHPRLRSQFWKVGALQGIRNTC